MEDNLIDAPAPDNRVAAMVIPRPDRSCLLTVNGGSSSLKFAIFPRDDRDPPRPILSGRIERIGLPDTRAILVRPPDSAFQHDLPRVARIIPIPRRYEAAGVRRYGFHGLSYAYLMEELARAAGPEAAAGRVVLAHLGSGASMAAVAGGRPIDTTMGLT